MADAAQPIVVNPNLVPLPAWLRDAAVNPQNAMFRRLTWRNRPRRRMLYNQVHHQRAVALRQRGFSYRQIARRMGPFCSCGTIYQWIRQAEARAQRQV